MDVLLKNGRTVEDIVVDEHGMILGKVVGGQTGVDERPLPFEQKDISAYRCKGWASRLGLARWRRLDESI